MKKQSIFAFLLLGSASLMAQDFTKPQTTEVWDPEPKVVTPAATLGAAPSDAIVLFNGHDLNEWVDQYGGSAQWDLHDKMFTVIKGKGDIKTRREFGDCQLHIEWQSPIESDTLKGQAKGNSGVFLQDRYEVQVLNSYQNRTYANGQAGCLYKQTPPLVNACSPMGEWNSYDIFYTAPRFRANGSVETPAYITVIHNGILIQNHTEIQGTTEYIGPPKNPMHGKGCIRLQDHGNKVSYRNIWIREL